MTGDKIVPKKIREDKSNDVTGLKYIRAIVKII
jgi:hypothetical protein